MSETQSSLLIDREYAGYEGIVGQGVLAPQTQGMLPEDFEMAMRDPRTMVTEVVSPTGDTIRMPQLSPVDNFSWLNTDFYKGKFPGEMDEGKVFNFTELPGIEPSEEVKDSLRKLADDDGVLVFDYPDADPAFVERMTAFLDSIGIKSSEVVELGTQTYYAGKFKVANGVSPSAQYVGLYDSLDTMAAPRQEVDDYTGPEYLRTVGLEQTQRMNKFYEKAFAEINEHPCRQGLTPEEFSAIMMEDPEIAKLVYKIGGEVCTVCILGDDLEKFDWVNPVFYKDKYSDEYDKKQIIYFPALATDTDMQGLEYAGQVLTHITEALSAGNNEVIVGFDCCDINAGFLNLYIEAIVNSTGIANIQFDNIGVQKYGGIKISNK